MRSSLTSFCRTAAVIAGATSILSCDTFQLLENQTSVLSGPSQFVCLKVDRDGRKLPENPHSSSPYQTLEFQDEFTGRAGTYDGTTGQPYPESCFDTSRALCKRRLDTNVSLPCSQAGEEMSHIDRDLKHLNKCVWQIFSGFSFWEGSNNVAMKAGALRVDANGIEAGTDPSENRRGKLVINVDLMDPPANGRPFHCGTTDKPGGDGGNINYYGTDCKIRTGGLDTAGIPSLGHPGRNFAEGRIESEIIFNAKPGMWPGFWMWRDDSGSPYSFTPATGRNYIPETDILESSPLPGKRVEATQTYVNWRDPAPMKKTPSHGTIINADVKHVYGVERREREVRFYVDDCYTKIVKDGDPSNAFNDLGAISVDPYPSNLIYTMLIQQDAALLVSPMLQGASMEVNWVKVWKK